MDKADAVRKWVAQVRADLRMLQEAWTADGPVASRPSEAVIAAYIKPFYWFEREQAEKGLLGLSGSQGDRGGATTTPFSSKPTTDPAPSKRQDRKGRDRSPRRRAVQALRRSDQRALRAEAPGRAHVR